LGFRGEALASISTIGKVEALTKTRDNNMGIQVLVENGKIKEKNIIGCQDGTTMIVKDIFYNLPVRQKFLKDENVESNYIGNIVNKLSLGNPNISFKYIRDNKMTLKTPGNGDLSSCIYSVLGKEILKGLIEVKSTYDSIKVYGLISNNNVYRGNRSHQYIYINGRYIKSYFLSGIIQECYRSLIPIIYRDGSTVNRYKCSSYKAGNKI
jgi:DNA mismatch repair protein MutL